MTETTNTVTSDAKLCKTCGAAFGSGDDKRCADCSACRGKVVEAVSSVSISPEIVGADYEPITLDVAKHQPPPVVDRDFYWCGVTKDAPRQFFTLGGICFPKTIGEIRDDGTKQVCHQDVYDGQIHRLTDTQVALIKEHAANKVVRNHRSEVVRELNRETHVYDGKLLSKNGSRMSPYDPQPGDIPLGCFVYMVRVRGKKDRPMQDPPAMVAR